MSDSVNHPAHYGGEANVYEAIKVIEAWRLGFCLGNAVKYIARAGKKGDEIEDLRKALWYLQREIDRHVGVRDRLIGLTEQVIRGRQEAEVNELLQRYQHMEVYGGFAVQPTGSATAETLDVAPAPDVHVLAEGCAQANITPSEEQAMHREGRIPWRE
jgi:Protein of unknwon function (DUF3310)